MDNNVQKRLQEAIDSLCNGNKSEFCRRIGKDVSSLKDIIGEKRSAPGYGLLFAILSSDLGISPNWLMLGEGPSAKSVRIDLPPFTLVGATTRTGLLSNPLRDRFGIDLRLSFYSPEDLAKIIMRSANILGTSIDADGALMLAKSARGTPRIANRLLKRARDFASALNRERITAETIKTTLFQLHIDECGLDEIDREYMTAIIRHYAGGPVGIENLGAALSEPADTIEDVIEPYLMQLGFVQRTPRGRVITDAGYRHLGLEK